MLAVLEARKNAKAAIQKLRRAAWGTSERCPCQSPLEVLEENCAVGRCIRFEVYEGAAVERPVVPSSGYAS